MPIAVTLKGGPLDGTNLKLAAGRPLDVPVTTDRRNSNGELLFGSIRYAAENGWRATRAS